MTWLRQKIWSFLEKTTGYRPGFSRIIYMGTLKLLRIMTVVLE